MVARSPLPVHGFVSPIDLDEARRRIVRCEREIANICRQLAEKKKEEKERDNWVERARRARERFREEEAHLYQWIADHHLMMLYACRQVIETVDDLNAEEEDLLDRLDDLFENK